MRRLRVRDPSGLCRALGGSIPYNVSSQKRTLTGIEKNPRGVIIVGSEVGGRGRRVKVKSHLPAFDLPNIVLDLDAEHSPHVRPFNEEDAAQQKAKWAHNPTLLEVEKRVAQLEEDVIQDKVKMDRMLAARHHPHKISDLDVLSVALLGGNDAASSQVDQTGPAVGQDISRHDALLRSRNQALENNGIPQRILASDANTIINFLLHRQRQAPAPHEAAPASVNENASDTFEAAVKDCKSLNQLRRLCSHSLSSGHVAITPASMDYIARWFTTLKKSSRSYNQDGLKFVNNLTMRQLSGNTGLSPSLSRVGLALAAHLALLPAIIQYLHICLSQGFIIGSTKDRPATLGLIGAGILRALQQGDGSARGTRPELFTLLTGRPLAGSTVQRSLFGSSLRSTEDDPETHRIYVQLLGQLGAYRLLWHSWKKGAAGKMNRYKPVYHSALARCTEVLRDANHVAGLDCTTATGDLERDAELDLQAIDALDAYHASSISSEDPSAFQSEDFQSEDSLSTDEVIDAFLSSDIQRAVALMNGLITIAGAAPTE